MLRVWSHRPRFLYLGLFFGAYVLGCGFAKALAIVPGITVSIWPPGGVFIATLILTSPYSWPWWILAGCLAEMFAQLIWFHSPLAVGFLVYVGNAVCAVVGATLLNRTCGRPVRLETLADVLTFVALGAGVAPLFSATLGSATLAWFSVKSQTFAQVWPLFWIGDATGILLFAPLALVVIHHWRSTTRLSAAQWMEANILGLIFLGVAAVSLSDYYLPVPYIIMPPLLWAAVRFEFKGGAVALALLALITMALTIAGYSQFVGDPESQRQKQIMLQLFLAISAFSALVVAALSRQHQLAALTLRQSERQLQQLVDMVPIHVWRLTREGEPSFYNKRLVDFLGFNIREETKLGMSLLSSAIADFVHPDDAAGLNEALNRSFSTGEPFSMSYRLRRADGTYRWLESRAEPMRDDTGAILQWYGANVDIHDLVTAQEALREREREFSQLVNMVPIQIWRLTPAGEPTFFNKRLIDFFGADVEDQDRPGMSRLAVSIDTFVHPDDAAMVRQALNHSFMTGESYFLKYRLRRADGVYRWVEARAEPLRDDDGRILHWFGLVNDIDDQLRADEALREQKRELSLLVDMVPSHLWRLTPDGETTLVNKRMADYVGLDLADKHRLETIMSTIFHPDDTDAVGEEFGRCLITGERFSMTYRLRRADGEHRWMSGRAEPLRDDSGRIIQWFGLCHDIHDQVLAEEGLRRASDRLAQAAQAASLAELSASIAHEVNQPLAAIVANAQACHRWLSADPPNIERAKITAERITRDANSAADVVSRIRALFRQAPRARLSVDINLLAGEVCRLMADEVTARNVRIEMALAPDLPSIALDRVQVQQVFVNLIRNGIEAMDDVVDGARALQIRSCRDGLDAIRVEFCDAGTGFKDAERALEPFFTTKPHGMGMGLAICRSIIESHGGCLWTANNTTRGATVSFMLPLAPGKAP